MQKVRFPNSNNKAIDMSAIIHFPDGFQAGQQYPAIIVTHPGGGVKEQTASTYARELAKQGFVTIVFDASYQGESGGEPRQLENPYIRTEDVSAVLDYLNTLPYVDNDRIGAMGICAGAGYTVNAAINDHRIRAVGTVSMVNAGLMFSKGWTGDAPAELADVYVQMGADARTSDAAGNPISTFPLAPVKESDATNEDLRRAWEYYHTPRAQHPNAPLFATSRSLTQLVTYDAFSQAETFLTQPLKMVVGSEAGSKWMSDDLLARAGSPDKSMHIIDGANHMDLYDVEACVNEAVSVLAPFFAKNLEAAKVTEPAE